MATNTAPKTRSKRKVQAAKEVYGINEIHKTSGNDLKNEVHPKTTHLMEAVHSGIATTKVQPTNDIRPTNKVLPSNETLSLNEILPSTEIHPTKKSQAMTITKRIRSKDDYIPRGISKRRPSIHASSRQPPHTKTTSIPLTIYHPRLLNAHTRTLFMYSRNEFLTQEYRQSDRASNRSLTSTLADAFAPDSESECGSIVERSGQLSEIEVMTPLEPMMIATKLTLLTTPIPLTAPAPLTMANLLALNSQTSSTQTQSRNDILNRLYPPLETPDPLTTENLQIFNTQTQRIHMRLRNSLLRQQFSSMPALLNQNKDLPTIPPSHYSLNLDSEFRYRDGYSGRSSEWETIPSCIRDDNEMDGTKSEMGHELTFHK